MKKINLVFSIILFFACAFSKKAVAQSNPKTDWITAYKNTVIIACLKAFDPGALGEDISGTLNYDILQDFTIIHRADSLGKAWYQTIKPSEITDLQHKKMVLNSALSFYTSKRLDAIAHAEYKRFQQASKNVK